MRMTRKQKRLATIAGLGVVLAAVTTLIFVALSKQLVFFYAPAQILAHEAPVGTPIRLGGLVKVGSFVQNGESSSFVVTDGKADIAATFTGSIPDLFREGQGVIAEGSMAADGSFVANKVLAKHDEKYMPREVVDALKKSGEWRPEDTAAAGSVQ
jgi:cytochrome c-type biogenesis protein CcmE